MTLSRIVATLMHHLDVFEDFADDIKVAHDYRYFLGKLRWLVYVRGCQLCQLF